MNNSPRAWGTAEYNTEVSKAMLEKVLQERVRQLLTLHGWRHYHTHLAKHSPAGFPDVCAIRGPRLLFAELKREQGKTSPAQDEWLADLKRFGALIRASQPIYDAPAFEVYLWRPSDLIAGRIAEVLK